MKGRIIILSDSIHGYTAKSLLYDGFDCHNHKVYNNVTESSVNRLKATGIQNIKVRGGVIETVYRNFNRAYK